MYHFLLLLSTPHSSLNQNLTLNYSESSLPSSTTFNEFAQMVLERLYPNEIDLNAKGSNFWTSEWGSWTYAPLVGTLNYSYNNVYNCRVASDIIDTDLTKIKFRGHLSDYLDYYIQIWDATGVTGLKNFYYSGSTSGKDFNETYDISDINEPFIIKVLSYGGYNKTISVSEFKLTN